MMCLPLTTPSWGVLVFELSQSIARFAPSSGLLGNLLCQIGTLLNSDNPLGQLTQIVNLNQLVDVLGGL
jgi:hypothetical protein